MIKNKIDLKKMIGMFSADALDKLQQEGVMYRIVREDDVMYAETADFSPDRVNLEIINGVVASTYFG